MFGIFTNINKDKDLAVTKQIIKALTTAGIEFKLHASLQPFFNNVSFFRSDVFDNGFELLISIGGDGTILNIAPFCINTQTPIIGVNMGNLGFLAEIEAKETLTALDLVLKKQYTIEERSVVEANFNNKTYLGLNEIVVSREHEGKMISLQVSVNDKNVDIFNCDGYIVSTPTGSTAYSLSAGGPILSPCTQAFVLTPINSHSLYSRPIVIRDSEPVKIELLRSQAGAAVFMDGEKVAAIAVNESITIKKSAKALKFLKLSFSDFYSRLYSKLNRKITLNGELD